MKLYIDKKYNFYELFNPNNGTLIRSDVESTNQTPLMRSFPELIDIGIMGHCEAGKTGICKRAGIDCYQNGSNSIKKNMQFDDYCWLITQCENKVFQVALGGCGDPNKHECFAEILKVTSEKGIVPNLTTSGYNLSDTEIVEIKKYCGAVAVSFYSRYVNGKETNQSTIQSIMKLVEAGCITNVHYVVSKDTIDEAIIRLKNNCFPDGISAVVFLLYKPVGLGMKNKMLTNSDRLGEFIFYATKVQHPFRVGFDTCFTSALVQSDSISVQSIDPCEAARFSMYIDSELCAYPCSFGIELNEFRYKLKPYTIQDAWDSDVFNKFRTNISDKCKGCSKNNTCLSGCKLNLDCELC